MERNSELAPISREATLLTSVERSNGSEASEDKSTMKLSRTNKITISAVLAIVVIVVVIISVLILERNNSNSSSDDFSDDSTDVVSAFQKIFPPNFYSTGVRMDFNSNVIIVGGTGTPNMVANTTAAFMYYGPLHDFPTESSDPSFNYLHPSFPNTSVHASYLYGPNTPFYDSRIGVGNYTAVGAYIEEGVPYQQSYLYQGPLNSSLGLYSKIKIPPKIVQNTSTGNDDTYLVGHTTAHSMMGDLIVGNYYYLNLENERCHGFIHNMLTGSYTTVDRGLSSTLYGVWQDGGQNSPNYTIIGGYFNTLDSSRAYLQTYNSETGAFGAVNTYSYGNCNTHFEGITAVAGGFFIAAQCNESASYVFLPVLSYGVYGDPVWTFLNDSITGGTATADTTTGYFLIGTAFSADGATSSSYILNTTAL
jgi:hypothetical protein